MADVNPIPDDYPRLNPYLCVDGAAEAIDWYVRIVGATERMRSAAPGDQIGHAELAMGDSLIMLSDPFPEGGVFAPGQYGGSPVMVSVYVDDVDAVQTAALEAGATEVRPVADQFHGDRSGQFTDPFGHRWNVASRVENVPADEMARRAAELYGE